MKKLSQFILSVALLAGVSSVSQSVQAQTTVNGITNAAITLTLVDLLVINVNIPAVPLVFATEENYKQGVNITIPAHVLVSSNRPYNLKVKANDDLKFGANTIPINNVLVQVVSTGMGTTPKVPLQSGQDVTVASAAPASMAKLIDVNYSTVPGSSSFVNTGVYLTTLTYSATSL